jgi:nitroimidazol reductase NimA-like FMN-containing flavoprotein (pyridoxamine 5'-phosphate oxidase superfamily)
MTATYTPTDRTTPTRLRERVSYERDAVHAALDEAVLCHVAFVVDGAPVVLPQLHVRVGETLYLHGSTAARAMRESLSEGLDVCVTVTHLDGLVLARSAFHHSTNYRCVVVHGRAELVTDPVEKEDALRHLVDAVAPGRSDHVRGPNRRELAATAVLRLALTDVSLKSRSGPPGDDEEDLTSPWWAGVLPLRNAVPGAPLPAPDLTAGIEVPAHVTGWSHGSRPGGGGPH